MAPVVEDRTPIRDNLDDSRTDSNIRRTENAHTADTGEDTAVADDSVVLEGVLEEAVELPEWQPDAKAVVALDSEEAEGTDRQDGPLAHSLDDDEVVVVEEEEGHCVLAIDTQLLEEPAVAGDTGKEDILDTLHSSILPNWQSYGCLLWQSSERTSWSKSMPKKEDVASWRCLERRFERWDCQKPEVEDLDGSPLGLLLQHLRSLPPWFPSQRWRPHLLQQLY